MTERIMGALLQLHNAMINCGIALARVIDNAFTILFKMGYEKKRVSYNAKYWKITANNSFNIKRMVFDMGSNEKCYYSKIDR